jgi:hypothetical protein
MPDAADIQALREQIGRTDAYTERECATILANFASILLTRLQELTFVNVEQNTSAGRVDFVIVAEQFPAGIRPQRIAYVWELKAPQCFLFKIDNSNRASPTPEFYSAENQLLHYRYAIANDGHFRNRWEIVSADRVKLGGIIIGREINLVSPGSYDPILAVNLANQAKELRENTFYHNDIKLLTWDRVLILAEMQTETHQTRFGDVFSRNLMEKCARFIIDPSGTSLPSAEFTFYTEPPTTDSEK